MGERTRRPVAASQTLQCTQENPNGTSQSEGFSDNSFLAASLAQGGAMGREGAVQAQHRAAYDLGRNAPIGSYDGTVFRNVGSTYLDTGLNTSYSAPSGGRYNQPNNALLYTSPAEMMSIGEANAYQGMANRTMIESHFQTSPDGTGLGGIADVSTAARQRGMTDVLTPHVGGDGPSLLHRITGEHPYSMTQQVGHGVADSGAAAMRAPSATGGEQINVIPRNSGANTSLTPTHVTPYDGHANAGTRTPAPSSIQPLSGGEYTPSNRNGAPPRGVVRPAETSGRSGVRGNVSDTVARATNPGTRASSVRYGALGGAAGSLIDSGIRAYNGEDVSLGDVVQNTATGTGIGAASGLADDVLVSSLGMSATRAGGVVGGVVEGGMSLYNNAGAYNRGEIDGAQAIANTAVDTGIGVGAGMAGAAAGAAIGSIIPGAGTAVGAALGFVGGMAASYLSHYLVEETGVGDWAKEKGGDALRWIGGLWD